MRRPRLVRLLSTSYLYLTVLYVGRKRGVWLRISDLGEMCCEVFGFMDVLVVFYRNLVRFSLIFDRELFICLGL